MAKQKAEKIEAMKDAVVQDTDTEQVGDFEMPGKEKVIEEEVNLNQPDLPGVKE